MSVNLTVNGVVYPFPNINDENWGDQATSWATAISQSTLQKTGATFTLSADVDFGATAGLKALYFKSRSTIISSTGVFRLANTESISWRNAANSADIPLTASSSNRLTFDGIVVPTISSIDTLTNKTLTSPVITTPTGIVKGDVGLGNVDNTSDVNKPVSTAQQTAINLKADTTSLTAHTGAASGVHGVTGAVVGTTDTQTLTNKTLTSPVLNTAVSGTAVLNENNMVSNSATQIPTQASVKAYVDSSVSAAGNVAYSVKSADYTVTTVDAIRTVGMTTAATNRTITLPAAASSTNRILTIKKLDSGTGQVIVDANASETIDGGLTLKLFFQYESMTIQCDGAGWVVLDYKQNNNDRAYTPTASASFGTLTVPAGGYRRVGNRMIGWGYFKAGTTTAATAQVTIPGSFTLDTAAASNAGNTASIWGDGVQETTAAGGIYIDGVGFKVVSDSGSNTVLGFATQTGTIVSGNQYGQVNANSICSANARIYYKFDIPILEWA